SVKELSGQICQICGDEREIIVDGEPFIACNECAFPTCRPCYEYQRREGNQAWRPQCKTRFKWIKGSPRVDGDEDEGGLMIWTMSLMLQIFRGEMFMMFPRLVFLPGLISGVVHLPPLPRLMAPLQTPRSIFLLMVKRMMGFQIDVISMYRMPSIKMDAGFSYCSKTIATNMAHVMHSKFK
ncbi:hypothetical protein M8C21_031954, partial [Ambrosia artemisiifolia]